MKEKHLWIALISSSALEVYLWAMGFLVGEATILISFYSLFSGFFLGRIPGIEIMEKKYRHKLSKFTNLLIALFVISWFFVPIFLKVQMENYELKIYPYLFVVPGFLYGILYQRKLIQGIRYHEKITNFLKK